MKFRLPAIPVISAMLLLVPLHSRGSSPEQGQPTTQGQAAGSTVWGGEHIVMEVTKDAATLDFDCATGTITEPLAVDTRGRFSVSGTFTRERPGPTPRNGNPAVTATYSGSIDNETMYLHIVAGANKEVVGDYALVRGQPGRVVKCR